MKCLYFETIVLSSAMIADHRVTLRCLVMTSSDIENKKSRISDDLD